MLKNIIKTEYVETDAPETFVSNDEAEGDSSLTMILVGKSKSGISTIANLFNKYKKLEIYPNQNDNGRLSTGFVNSRRTTLVDIPGFFAIDDDKKRSGKLLQSYTKSITTEIILFVVLRVAPITTYDIKLFNLIRKINKQRHILQNIVIFTCNESDAEGFSVDNFIQQSRELSDFISSCNCKSCVLHSSPKKESENAERFFSVVDELIEKTNDCMENTTIINESCDKVDQGKVEQMANHSDSRPLPPKESTTHTLFRKRTVNHFDSLKEKTPECFGPVPLKQQKEEKKRRTECCSRCTLL